MTSHPFDVGRNRLKQLQRALKRDPADFEANLQLGLWHLRREESAQALPYLEKAAAREERADLSFLLAGTCATLARDREAEAHYRRAIELAPEGFDPRYHFGLFLNRSGRRAEAIDQLERAAALQPENHELRNDIGVLCYQEKRYDEAVSHLRQAIARDDRYTLAVVNLGYVYLAMNRLDAVRALLDSLPPAQAEDAEVAELRKQFALTAGQNGRGDAELPTALAFSDQLLQIQPLRILQGFGEASATDPVALSVVVPLYNEAPNLPPLHGKLTAVLKDLRQAYEIIFVDDGSSDGSREILAGIAASDARVRVILFRRNYGQTAALNAGFKYARGGVIVTLDGDLQNDPADIPRLLAKMAEGYDLVSGWRRERQDTFVTRKIPSFVANRIINKLIEGTGVQLHDFGCTLKAYKRGIVKNIHLYGEMHRFIPVFAAWLGVKVAEIPVTHHPRQFGVAKYGLSRVSRVIFDLIVVRFFSDYMTRPIQFFGKIAKKLLGWGSLAIVALALASLFTALKVSFSVIVLLSALLLFATLQILSMGLLGEIMIRSYFETQRKDYYTVERILNDGESR